MRLRFTTTSFSRPLVGREDYNEIRGILNHDPTAEIEPKSDTIAKHFSGHMDMFKYCGIGLLIGAIGTGIFGEPSIFVAVSGLSMAGLMFTGLLFLVQAPSYASFKRKKATFFEELKFAILNTSSYEEFDLAFNKKR
jgi:hypothetical protein